MKKQFKNNFGVTGPKNLLQAFAKDCEEIGWKLGNKLYSNTSYLFFRADYNGTELKPGEYHWATDWGSGTKYTLPKDYNSALEAAKETIEEELKPGDWVRVERKDNKWTSLVCSSMPPRDMMVYYGQFWAKKTTNHTGYHIGKYGWTENAEGFKITKLSKEEAEEHILKQAIEESGLKVGDILNTKILTKWGESGINYYDESWQKDETGEDYYDERCIAKFDIKEGIPAFLVSDTVDIWLKLEGFSKFAKEYQEQSITIGEYETEVLNGKLKWGCQQISVEELKIVKKLLNSEISADITIHGTKIDKTLIEKLEKLLQNE